MHWFILRIEAGANDTGRCTYNLKEAALLFESGSYKMCDHSILVTAPKRQNTTGDGAGRRNQRTGGAHG
ncbi:hypothetical protein CS542_07540 [Pedobacter sp. IW39]|nr:hypothetical protein CS542_07540 [Pedobacter sp. IW39]